MTPPPVSSRSSTPSADVPCGDCCPTTPCPGAPDRFFAECGAVLHRWDLNGVLTGEHSQHGVNELLAWPLRELLDPTGPRKPPHVCTYEEIAELVEADLHGSHDLPLPSFMSQIAGMLGHSSLATTRI